MDARLTRENGAILDSVVSDLSLEGCCVTGSFPIGERLTVQLTRIGTFHGQVRWSLCNRSGIRFDRKDGAAA